VASKVVPIVVGSPAVLRRARRLVGKKISILPISREELSDVGRSRGVYVLCPRGIRPAQTGRGDARLRGRMSVASVREAARLCTAGHASALVTAPISKASLEASGARYVGHTEMLREFCQARQTVMMFVWGKHRISLVTTHVPVSTLKRSLTKKRIATTIRMTEKALGLLFRVTEPRIAVLSLNPHGGEGGLLGREEERVIEPAVSSCRKRGARVYGPFSADSFFSRDEWKTFDAVVAMYHDQGLIPAKIIGGERAVNITLGLPFVRTSPAHGTAEDIAWKGIADSEGMSSAILLAAKLGRNLKFPLVWD
jgi:4-hydroxythreonine-4-phosphate dehydrogenase